MSKDFLGTAIKRFSERPRLSVEVPEWSAEGAPTVVVHFRAPTAALLARANREAPNDSVRQAAMLVAMSVTDADGNRLLLDADVETLMREVDPAGTARVADAILNAGSMDVKAAEKN